MRWNNALWRVTDLTILLRSCCRFAILSLVQKKDIVAFANRDWDAIAASKRQRWAAQKAQMTAADALQVGDDLRAYVKSLHDRWPTEEDRRSDLAVHMRVSGSLRRVDAARRH